MAEILKPDLCIIGAGTAALAAAAEARAVGASVLLVETARNGPPGRDTRDIALSALAAAGQRAQDMCRAAALGLPTANPRISFRAVHEYVHATIAALAPETAGERLAALGIDTIQGEARFIDQRTLGAGDVLVRARRFVIATGARPVVPDIPRLDEVPYFTEDTIFENTRKLTHLVVFGASSAGLALAQAQRRLGAEVTVIEAARPLAHVDPELAAIALGRLREEGVVIREETRVREIVPRSQGIGVLIEGAGGATESLDASHILVAAGHAPDFDGLDLDKARIVRDPADTVRLALRPGGRTTNRRVLALGGAAGRPEHLHIARQDAGAMVRRALLGLGARPDDALLPRITFIDPEIAEVGLSEPEAKARHKDRYSLVRVSYAESARARALGETHGLARMITDRAGRIVGAGAVGFGARELIALFALAIANGLSAAQLRAGAAPHPSFAELAARLGEQHDADPVPDARTRRLLALNRLLP